jgi:hypothetical protein
LFFDNSSEQAKILPDFFPAVHRDFGFPFLKGSSPRQLKMTIHLTSCTSEPAPLHHGLVCISQVVELKSGSRRIHSDYLMELLGAFNTVN